MNINIKKIKMDNFKNFENAEFEFPKLAHIVEGRNASGKSTIVDSVSWALFDKLADGTTANKIRPVDVFGNVKHYIDIKVELTLDIDGTEMVICKTQSEVWTTPRGKAEQEFGGNKNSYEVNGVPMTEKAYKAKIAEIINEDVFRFASVLGAFTNLDQKKRREMLLKLADAEAVDNILKNEYPDIYAQYLDKYTVDEVNAMTAKALKEYKRELDTIPIRIDELAKQRVSGNLNQLLGEAADIRHELATDSDEPIKAKIAELESKKRQIVNEASIANADRKYAILKEYNKAIDAKDELESKIRHLEREKDNETDALNLAEEKIKALRGEYTRVMAAEIHIEDTCPTCHRKLAESKIEVARKEHEKARKNRLKSIESEANKLKKDNVEIENKIETLDSSILAHKTLLEDAKKALKTVADELASAVDVTADTSEIDAEIESYKAKLGNTDKHNELAEKLKALERQIALVESNEKIDKRINELNEQRQELSAKIAMNEKVKFQLEELTRRRTGLLTEEVNSHFKYVEWVLFSEQINGGIREICDATIDGCVVGNGLNTGHTILAYVDICAAMQNVYGTSIFMFVDNAESLSGETEQAVSERANTQTIFLKVAEKDLEVI